MRILQLSTHTTLVPRHGGKLRSHHVARVLEKSGFDVRRMAFCYRAPDDVEDLREPIVDVGQMPFWRSSRFDAYGPCRYLLGDYIATVEALNAPYILAEFDRLFVTAAPDVVLLEHPWTWPVLARLDDVRSGAVKVVYNSQNVEINLKKKLLLDQRISAPPQVIEGIESLERDLVAHADGISVCTREDGDVYIEWGAPRVVVVPNGGEQRDRQHLVDILPYPITPDHSYVLVVGSNHPPNVSGFINLVVPALLSLRPWQRIVVAGGMGPAVIEALDDQQLIAAAKERLVVLGTVDEFSLDCVIANANALLLPIQYGGGSNVKTVEALLSRQPVIAASAAMRGFEAFGQLPNVTIVDDSTDFCAAILASLDQPSAHNCSHPALASLLWESSVAPLNELMRDIEAEKLAELGQVASHRQAAE